MRTFTPGTPSWVDLASPDIKASSGFYGALFGWTSDILDFRIRTWRYGPTDSTGMSGLVFLSKDGEKVASIGPAVGNSTGWSILFATNNVEENAAKVESAGGTVALQPGDFLDWGRQAVFLDPSGVQFSMWEPATFTGANLVGVPGSMTWVELATDDVHATTSFYKAVLGYSDQDVDTHGTTRYTMLLAGGTPVAGLTQKRTTDEHRSTPSGWLAYFAVDDCDTVADKAVQLGGTEVLRDDSVIGRRALLNDPHGTAFCIVKRHA